MQKFFQKWLPAGLLVLSILLYSVIFSLLSIHRVHNFHAHYFDLGIMHQTVYNTYKGLQTGDYSRILEMSNPHASAEQLKRMAIHNDFGMALLAPFYFVHDGPETLLVIQSVALALGAFFIFLISKDHFNNKSAWTSWAALLLSLAYLMYAPMQRANLYEFHAVTLAVPLLLGMYYFWMKKRLVFSGIFALLAMSMKEQIGLTIAMFGIYINMQHIILRLRSGQVHNLKEIATRDYWKKKVNAWTSSAEGKFGLFLFFFGLFWSVLSLKVITPFFRGDEHFAQKYYGYLFHAPWKAFRFLFGFTAMRYVGIIFGPVLFLSFLSPWFVAIIIPELMINLLSTNANMRNIYFHYDAVLTPFVFIGAIHGIKRISKRVSQNSKLKLKNNVLTVLISFLVLMASVLTNLWHGPIRTINASNLLYWRDLPTEYQDVMLWKQQLADDQIKVSSTGHLAPHFTSRQYYYDFSWKYPHADYIVINDWDVEYGFLDERTRPAYTDLQNDRRYEKIYDRNGIEVWKRVESL